MAEIADEAHRRVQFKPRWRVHTPLFCGVLGGRICFNEVAL